MPNPQLTNPGAITESDWKYYLGHTPESLLQEIAEGLKNENRYFVDERFQRLLFTYFFDPQSRFFAQTEITPSATLYRARIYNEPDAMDRFDAPVKYDQFQGYDRGKSSAPPSENAGDGRANPNGIRYLYTASDPETAIKEARAQPGEFVSVATVKPRARIMLADLSNSFSALEAESIDKTKWINTFVLCLESYFQRPQKTIGSYYLCQYVSEYVKVWGFGGIRYRASTIQKTLGSDSVNVTFFHPENCEIVSSKLYYLAESTLTMEPPIN